MWCGATQLLRLGRLDMLFTEAVGGGVVLGCMSVKLSVPYDVGCEANRTIDMSIGVLWSIHDGMEEPCHAVCAAVGDAVIWLIVALCN